MSGAKKKVIARAADYNGHKDVLFLMRAEDFRLTDERFSGNYTTLGAATHDARGRTATCEGVTYRVFPDWSVAEIETVPVGATRVGVNRSGGPVGHAVRCRDKSWTAFVYIEQPPFDTARPGFPSADAAAAFIGVNGATPAHLR